METLDKELHPSGVRYRGSAVLKDSMHTGNTCMYYVSVHAGCEGIDN